MFGVKKTASLLLCGVLILSLAGCSGKKETRIMDPTVVVRTSVAKKGELSAESTYIGTISAEGTAAVVAMVSGTVEKIRVAVGETVVAGQQLCSFDDTSAQLNLESARTSYSSAQAGVASANAAVAAATEGYQGALANYGGAELSILEEQLRMAQENYASAQALFEIGAASRVEVDQAHSALLAAQGGLEAATASLSSAEAGIRQAEAGRSTAQAGMQAAAVGVAAAEYQLTLYNLTTPINGVVEAINVTENNFTGSGTVAFVISNAQNKNITFYVTDEVRTGMKLGQAVSVSVRNMNYTGFVSEISGVVGTTTGLFQCKALIDGAQELPDGLVAELTTVSYSVRDDILIPCDALYFDNGDAYVYVVRDGAAVRCDVTLSLYTREYAAISSGLDEGDEVIVTWSSALKSGAPVRLAEADETAEDAAAALRGDEET